MKFLRLLLPVFFFPVIFFFLLNSPQAFGMLNNRNVYVGFFHQKEKNLTYGGLNKSFQKAFIGYLKSKKPYFVLAYSTLNTPPYFNFNKTINLVRIKELALRYHSNFIVTGNVSRLGSHFELHAMLIEATNIYNSKTYNYSGSGTGSLAKNIMDLSQKVSLLILSSQGNAKAVKGHTLSSRSIYGVRVKGNIRVGAGFILNKVKVEKGELYSIDKINDSVKSLYSTGYFNNILVDVKPSPDGLIITFIVTERPFMKYIKYSGNGSVPVKKIKEIINLKPDTPYSSFEISKAKKTLALIYSAEGYYNAKIKVETKKFPGNYVGVSFDINQNTPVMVKTVKFEGNSAFSSKKLASVMGIKTVGLLTWITGTGKFKKARLSSQIIKLLSFYYNHGYINVSVGRPKFVFSKDKKYVTIIINVSEGPQYRISEVDLEIANVKKTSKQYLEAKKLLITKVGDLFNRKNIEKEILSITKYFTDKGYAFVDVKPSIHIDQKTSSVRVGLIVHRGKIAKFGKITVSGNDVTYSYVILRALVIYPGEKYNPELINASRQNLKNLMYFKHVTITTEKVQDKNILDVNVHVEEQNTGKFTIGGGYSTATRFMAITSLSEANIFGTGISASINVQVGGPYQSYSFNIFQPYLTYIFARPLSLNFSAFDNFNSLYYEFAYRSVGGSVTFGYPLYRNILTEYLRYMIEQDNSIIIQGLNNIVPQGKITTSEVSLTTVLSTLNNPMVPTSGDMDSLQVSYAGPPIGGNDDFVQYIAQANHYIPLWWGTSFMQGMQLGYITATRSSNPLPIYQRFFVGGITNTYPLLGFMYDSVGPTENGLLTGGTKFFTVQARYMIPISRVMKFYGFLWWNAGNDWTQSDPVFPLGLVQAAGIGFNWYSPFGPITITYGKILGAPINGNNPTRIQFSLGEGLPGL